MQFRRFLTTLFAYAMGALIAAMIVAMDIRPANDDASVLAYLAMVFVYCLLGPLLFTWALGPGALSALELAVAVALPLLSVSVLYFGYLRRHSAFCLVLASGLWGGFGGVSAWIAITGGV